MAKVENFSRMLCISLLTASTLYAQTTSTWAYSGTDQQLHYAQDAGSNRIMNFSFAGYKGGGVRSPVLPVVVTVTPTGGDDTIEGGIESQTGAEGISPSTRFP